MALPGRSTVEVDGRETGVVTVEGPGPPVLFVHGNPTCADDWSPFLDVAERRAVAIDLPGFGATPAGPGFGATMHDYGDFVHRVVDTLELERFSLVVHDWGAAALIAAQRMADRIERLIIIDAVPLLAGYRWHWLGRVWRRRGLGELANLLTVDAVIGPLLRPASPLPGPMAPSVVEMVKANWDREMGRCVCALYRSADPEALATAATDLDALRAPVLVLWGEDDPYVPAEFASRYADTLPDARFRLYARAGHWPWLDRPEIVADVWEFLADGTGSAG